MAFLAKKKNIFYICEKFKANGSWSTKWVKIGNIAPTQAKAVLLRYHSDQTYLKLDMGAPSTLTVSELILEFTAWQKTNTRKKPKTIRDEFNFLQQVEKRFGGVRIGKFDHDAFTAWTIEKGYEPQTVIHYARATRLMFKFAMLKRYLNFNPADKITRPKLIRKPPKFAQHEDVMKVFEAMDIYERAPFMCMYYAGLRPSEAFRLKVKNINLKTNSIDLYPDQTKTAESGILPMHSELVPLFKKLIAEKSKDDFLFVGKNGHVVDLSRRWLKACKEARVKLTQYQLRHTFATRLLEKTGDIRVVQQLMRHKSIQMTTRYATALDSRLRDAIDNF